MELTKKVVEIFFDKRPKEIDKKYFLTDVENEKKYDEDQTHSLWVKTLSFEDRLRISKVLDELPDKDKYMEWWRFLVYHFYIASSKKDIMEESEKKPTKDRKIEIEDSMVKKFFALDLRDLKEDQELCKYFSKNPTETEMVDQSEYSEKWDSIDKEIQTDILNRLKEFHPIGSDNFISWMKKLLKEMS